MSTSSGTSSSSTSNNTNNNKNSNNSKSSSNKKIRGPGRPPKKTSKCNWCGEQQTLNYVLPTQNGKKEFCSEVCIMEFRRSYSKGACLQCDNIIKSNAPSKDYCSPFCMNKHQKKNLSSTSSKTTTPINNNNNNNDNLNNNNTNLNNNNNTSNYISNIISNISRESPVTPTGPFQYESFHVFNWDEYLKVRIFVNIFFLIGIFFTYFVLFKGNWYKSSTCTLF